MFFNYFRLALIACFFLNADLHVLASVPDIRVKIADDVQKFLISGTDIKKDFYYKNEVKNYDGMKKLEFNCGVVKSVNQKGPILLASIHSKTGLLSLNNDKYLGHFLLLGRSNKLGCYVVNETSLERYISSLLAREMNSSWDLEALKAQAVAARSYAYQKIKNQEVLKQNGKYQYFDLESSEKDQVSGTFFDTNIRTDLATKETLGEILVSKTGKVVPVFFHAKCGGQTITPDKVWENKVEGYRSVKCPFCASSGQKDWNYSLSYKRFLPFIEYLTKNNKLKSVCRENFSVHNFILVRDQVDNLKIRFYVDDNICTIDKSEFRKFFGRSVFPSNRFFLTKTREGIELSGKGLGHGVGMCQIGALEMARKGFNYRQILAFYYPDLVLKKVYIEK